MSEPDDTDMIAAEYALGSLDAEERARTALRRRHDAALDNAITEWEQRLAPLNEAAPPVAAPAALFNQILARIDGADSAPVGGGSNIISLERGLRNWRRTAIGAGALAASLMLGIGLREASRRSEPRNFVAVMQKDAVSPAFIVSVDLDSRALTIRAVAADAQPGKSYQLWLVNATLGGPKSLGLLRPEGLTVGPKLAAFDPAVIENATYAVSLEPEGGSPAATPTGPVLFTGKLLQTGL